MASLLRQRKVRETMLAVSIQRMFLLIQANAQIRIGGVLGSDIEEGCCHASAARGKTCNMEAVGIGMPSKRVNASHPDGMRKLSFSAILHIHTVHGELER